MTDLDFSVIFPTYNRCEVVEETLQRLIDQDYPKDRFEIIAVDNSTDGTPAMVERMAEVSRASGGPAIRLLRLPERLPAIKRNRGLEVARGRFVYFINDDMWFAPDALSQHAATHASWTEPVAVLGSCFQSPRMPRTTFTSFYDPFPYNQMTGFVDGPVPYRFFWSMNLSLPRDVMIERNLRFHEDWAHIGHEDIELGWRWCGAGLKAIYNPRALGEHYHPHTLASACRLQESIGRGLRDLEVLVPDEDMLTRYGVVTRHAAPRTLIRSLVRAALFNSRTVPPLMRVLDGNERDSFWARWVYWKIMLWHTNYGYRHEPRRHPSSLVSMARPYEQARP
ncbi:MAG: hypothetical protein QOJ90_511 [Actinomycetota bacterium]|nr:hypothetical protein [Actinomycetota bacterium]MDQ1641160.1 hypothetical protein [Actinomycetota bacterium]